MFKVPSESFCSFQIASFPLQNDLARFEIAQENTFNQALRLKEVEKMLQEVRSQIEKNRTREPHDLKESIKTMKIMCNLLNKVIDGLLANSNS